MYEKLSRLQSEKKKRKKKKENDARDERKKEKKRKKIKEAERRKCERQRGSTDTFHSATSTINPFYLISFSKIRWKEFYTTQFEHCLEKNPLTASKFRHGKTSGVLPRD